MCFFLMIRRPPRSTLFPLHDALPISDHPVGDLDLGRQRELGLRADHLLLEGSRDREGLEGGARLVVVADRPDRKSTRLNSSHANISYAVFCLKKKNKNEIDSICTRSP